MASRFVQHAAYASTAYTITAVGTNAVTVQGSISATTSQRSCLSIVKAGVLYVFPFLSWSGSTFSGVQPDPSMDNMGGSPPYPRLVVGDTIIVHSVPATAPPFGTTQEGDGLAPGLAVCATVQIDMSTMVVGSSASIGILGATVALTAGWTPAQIAGAINSTTSPSATTPVDTGWGTPKLCNAVYATTSGSILQIQTRAGSEKYNGMPITAANITNWPGTNPSFSGGVSGCWGYLTNTDDLGIAATMWPTAMAANTYGPYSSNLIAGPIVSVSDFTYVRGNNGFIAAIQDTTHSPTLFACASVAGMTLLVDNGTYWPGDQYVFHWRSEVLSANGGQIATYGGLSNGGLTFGPMVGATALFTLHFGLGRSGAGNARLSFMSATIVEQLNTYIIVGYTYVPFLGVYASFVSDVIDFMQCSITSYRTQSQWLAAPFVGPNQFSTYITIEDCDLYLPNVTGVANIFSLVGNTSPSNSTYRLEVSNLRVFSPGDLYVLGPVTGNLRLSTIIVVENCSGCLSNNNVGLFGSANTATSSAPDETSYIIQQNIGATRQFQHETQRTVITLVTGPAYPTMNALTPLPDGTPWSYSVLWAGVIMAPLIRTTSNGSEYLVLSETVASVDGLLGVVTLDLLVPPSEASVTNHKLGIAVSYVDSNGVSRIENSFPSLLDRVSGTNATALPLGSSDWVLNSYTTYLPRRIVVTLSHIPKVNTDIQVSLRALKTASNATAILFVNPVVGIS